MRKIKHPLSISATATTRAAELAGITDPNARSRLVRADIILLPRVAAEASKGPAFTSHTRDILRFLRARLPASTAVEVATETDEVAIVILHGELFDLGVFLASTAGAPLLLNMLANYLYDKIRAVSSRRESTVRCRMMIERTDGSCSALDYDGPADTFEGLLRAEMTKAIGNREHDEQR